MTPSKNQDCLNRHKPLWRVVTVILFIVTLTFTAVGWSIGEATSGKSQIMEIKQEFAVHEAAQVESIKHMDRTLLRIEKSVGSQRQEIKEVHELVRKLHISN